MLSDRVLFIDGEAIIIDKPAGLPVDRPRDRAPSVEDMLESLTFGFQRRPLPVHRLDRDTSGCLLLARNPKAHKRFQRAFEAGPRHPSATSRSSTAIPARDSGTIDLPLIKISSAEEGWRMTGAPNGKPALSRWRVIERARGRAMVAFFPETGRTHQLRVHAAEGLGIPIVGDPVYGTGGPAVMLHAAGLILPRAGKPDVAAEAPLPVRFHNLGFGHG